MNKKIILSIIAMIVIISGVVGGYFYNQQQIEQKAKLEAENKEKAKLEAENKEKALFASEVQRFKIYLSYLQDYTTPHNMITDKTKTAIIKRKLDDLITRRKESIFDNSSKNNITKREQLFINLVSELSDMHVETVLIANSKNFEYPIRALIADNQRYLDPEKLKNLVINQSILNSLHLSGESFYNITGNRILIYMNLLTEIELLLLTEKSPEKFDPALLEIIERIHRFNS